LLDIHIESVFKQDELLSNIDPKYGRNSPDVQAILQKVIQDQVIEASSFLSTEQCTLFYNYLNTAYERGVNFRFVFFGGVGCRAYFGFDCGEAFFFPVV